MAFAYFLLSVLLFFGCRGERTEQSDSDVRTTTDFDIDSKTEIDGRSTATSKNADEPTLDTKPLYPAYPQVPPPSSLFQPQPTKFRQDFSTLPIVVNADRISRPLRKLANEDMGVYSMQVSKVAVLYLLHRMPPKRHILLFSDYSRRDALPN